MGNTYQVVGIDKQTGERRILETGITSKSAAESFRRRHAAKGWMKWNYRVEKEVGAKDE